MKATINRRRQIRPSRAARLFNGKGESGATLIEGAIGIPLFLLFTFLTMELARLAYINVASQFAVNNALRSAAIGPAQFGGISQRDYLLREIQRLAAMFAVPVNPGAITICQSSPIGANQACGNEVSGGPGELVSVEITVPVQLWLLGTYSAGAYGVTTNERW